MKKQIAMPMSEEDVKKQLTAKYAELLSGELEWYVTENWFVNDLAIARIADVATSVTVILLNQEDYRTYGHRRERM